MTRNLKEQYYFNFKLQEKQPRVIAEIGGNHKGSIEIAKEMIEICSTFCKADIVKFQKRNPKESLSKKEYCSPHPVPENSYGSTYGEHREFLEFNLEQHRLLKQYCEDHKVIYSCSIWDMTSTKEICSLQPELIKIPSACNTNFEMLDYLIQNFSGEIHVSLGMTTQKEEEEIVSYFEKNKRNQDLVLYACTSGYPVAFEDICLGELIRLKSKYGNRVKEIGFSGHHLGIAADIGALALGATVFERHFTLNRTWKGTDHAASLEPDGLRKLVRDIQNVSKALCFKGEDIIEVEKVQRKKLKWNRSQE